MRTTQLASVGALSATPKTRPTSPFLDTQTNATPDHDRALQHDPPMYDVNDLIQRSPGEVDDDGVDEAR